MNLHCTTTEFNAGIDLHTKNMYVCVMDREGKIYIHREIRGNSLAQLDKHLEPYAGRVTVCCESTVNWYFLADHLADKGIPFVLGHSLYITAISKSKKKNDRVDSQRLADLLRSNLLPVGYTCPRRIREIRDLCRRRRLVVETRTTLKTSLTTGNYGYGAAPLTLKEKQPARRRDAYLSRVPGEAGRLGCENFLETIEFMDRQVKRLEDGIQRLILDDTHFRRQFELLASFPGIGKTLGASILFEISDINRFASPRELSSYARLIAPQGTSDGKSCGTRGAKIGNPHLKYAIKEAAVSALRVSPVLHCYFEWLAAKSGKRRALSIFAHRYGIAVYFALKRGQSFSLESFLKGKPLAKFTAQAEKKKEDSAARKTQP